MVSTQIRLRSSTDSLQSVDIPNLAVGVSLGFKLHHLCKFFYRILLRLLCNEKKHPLLSSCHLKAWPSHLRNLARICGCHPRTKEQLNLAVTNGTWHIPPALLGPSPLISGPPLFEPIVSAKKDIHWAGRADVFSWPNWPIQQKTRCRTGLRAQVSLPNVSVQLAVIHTELPFPAGDSFGSSKRFHGPRH